MYRVHLDLATTSAAHQAELVARLTELGATPADVGQGDVPWTVLADPEGNVFCVLEPREVYPDTGPIAAVVVDCADPRAMARFWGEATDWTLHEVTDDYARLRAAKGVGPYLEFFRTPGVRPVAPVPSRPGAVPGGRSGGGGGRLEALGATDADVGQGDVPWRSSPIPRATSSACWVGAERGRGPGVGRLAGEADGGRSIIAGLVPGPASPRRISALKFPCPRDQAPWSFVLQDRQQPAPVTGSIAFHQARDTVAEESGPGDEGRRQRPGHRLIRRRRLRAGSR